MIFCSVIFLSFQTASSDIWEERSNAVQLRNTFCGAQNCVDTEGVGSNVPLSASLGLLAVARAGVLRLVSPAVLHVMEGARRIVYFSV